MNREDIKYRRNFLSADKQIAQNSYGEYFEVGEFTKHQDPNAGVEKILKFQFDEQTNEVIAVVGENKEKNVKRVAHIDFLVKIPEIIKYEHHGAEVSVQKENKGKHRDNCLCFHGCKYFNPEDRENNCEIANKLFKLCVDYSLATPVWECAKFEQTRK